MLSLAGLGVVTLLIVLFLLEDKSFFSLVLGIVLGGAFPWLLRWADQKAERRRLARGSAVLVRSDFYAHQDWIRLSIHEGEWRPQPGKLATKEDYAAVAHALPQWDDWTPISQAIRFIDRLSARAETRSIAECKALAGATFLRIDGARVALAKIDDGPEDPNENSEWIKEKTGATAD